MKKKRSYCSVDVEKFDLTAVLGLLTLGCIVAVDVAKEKFVAAIATAAGEVLKLVRFEHPRQTAVFLCLLKELQAGRIETKVVMEPTGTYGDSLRYQCHSLGLPVHMIPPKHTHDFSEVVDGVPSMHDAKAAVVLAKLQVIRPGKLWKEEPTEQRDWRALLERRVLSTKCLRICHGHLEALLARHWPEFAGHMNVHLQRSWFALLKQFPGPQAISDQQEAARQTLWRAGRGALRLQRVNAIVESAQGTLGVPMTLEEQHRLAQLVTQIEYHVRTVEQLDKLLARSADEHASLKRVAAIVGPACAVAIGSCVGMPEQFASAKAFEKALGLNLKERSSGKHIGQLKLTKRGPGIVRQLLYLAALRIIDTNRVVQAWYRRRKGWQQATKLKAVAAVMRKLARALWHVAHGSNFDTARLFDLRRLKADLATHGSDAARRRSGPRARVAHSPLLTVGSGT